MSTVTHSFRRQFAISKLPQVNYDTPWASGVGGANYRRLLMSGEQLVDEQPNVVNNRNYAKGQRQATDSWIVSHDALIPFGFDICSEEIGRWLLLVFGKVVTTQPNVDDNPLVYRHVFSFMDVAASAQPPVTSVVEQCGAAMDTLYPSAACQSLSFRGEGPQRLGASGNLMGSGKAISPSGITIPAAGDLHYLYQGQVALSLDDGDTVTNAFDAPQRLNSWEFAANNVLGLDDGFRPGAQKFQDDDDPNSGEVRSECLLLDQDYVMRYNLRVLSDSTFWAALRAQTPFIPMFDIIGPPIDDDFNHGL